MIVKDFTYHSNPEIIRLEWLPPYEEMKGLVVGIKDGTLNYKVDGLKLLINMGFFYDS